ncbi:MAG: hypothetical protein ACYTXE_25570 [Nostoc sp.]
MPIAIAQKLLEKIDLSLSYVGRLGPSDKQKWVYQFIKPDDERNCIFEKWLSRDASQSDAVSGTSNIGLTPPITNLLKLPKDQMRLLGASMD